MEMTLLTLNSTTSAVTFHLANLDSTYQAPVTDFEILVEAFNGIGTAALTFTVGDIFRGLLEEEEELVMEEEERIRDGAIAGMLLVVTSLLVMILVALALWGFKRYVISPHVFLDILT